MALKRYEKYPNRWSPATPEQPQGAFKNRTTSVSKDGSYIEKDWANDWSGFFSAALGKAGIVPNGEVDTALSSQYYEAFRTFFYNPENKPNAVDIGAADRSHGHQIANVNGLQSALDSKSANGHKHNISDVNSLQANLDSKLNLTGGALTGRLECAHDGAQFKGRARDAARTDVNDLMPADSLEWSYHGIGRTAPNIFPVDSNANAILSYNLYAGGYGYQIGFSSNRKLYFRSQIAGSWSGWVSVHHSGMKAADMGAYGHVTNSSPTDCNTMLSAAHYDVPAGSANWVSSTSGGSLTVFRHSSDSYIGQLAVAGGAWFVRNKNGSTWSSWERICTTGYKQPVDGLGYGQKWKDVLSSRSAGVNYTNSSGRPISIFVSTKSADASTMLMVTVDGVLASEYAIGGGVAGTSRQSAISAVIPVGSVYSVTSNGDNRTIISWSELS